MGGGEGGTFCGSLSIYLSNSYSKISLVDFVEMPILSSGVTVRSLLIIQ